MEENVQATSLFQDAMKKGLILGVIHIIYFLLLYAFAPGKLTGVSSLAFIIIVNVSYIIYFGIQWRKELGGFMNYGTAFKHAFFIFLFNGILGLVFILIFILVEPSLPEAMAEGQVNTSVYWAQSMGAPPESLDDMRDKMDMEDLKSKFGLFGQVKSFGLALIIYAITSLIIALITKKQEPETM